MEEYGVGDTPDISPTFFFSEVQLAAFSAIFRPFGTEVWIGSFDRIYGRRRRGPPADGNVSEPWQLQIDSRLVYLPSVGGD